MFHPCETNGPSCAGPNGTICFPDMRSALMFRFHCNSRSFGFQKRSTRAANLLGKGRKTILRRTVPDHLGKCFVCNLDGRQLQERDQHYEMHRALGVPLKKPAFVMDHRSVWLQAARFLKNERRGFEADETFIGGLAQEHASSRYSAERKIKRYWRLWAKKPFSGESSSAPAPRQSRVKTRCNVPKCNAAEHGPEIRRRRRAGSRLYHRLPSIVSGPFPTPYTQII